MSDSETDLHNPNFDSLRNFKATLSAAEGRQPLTQRVKRISKKLHMASKNPDQPGTSALEEPKIQPLLPCIRCEKEVCHCSDNINKEMEPVEDSSSAHNDEESDKEEDDLDDGTVLVDGTRTYSDGFRMIIALLETNFKKTNMKLNKLQQEVSELKCSNEVLFSLLEEIDKVIQPIPTVITPVVVELKDMVNSVENKIRLFSKDFNEGMSEMRSKIREEHVPTPRNIDPSSDQESGDADLDEAREKGIYPAWFERRYKALSCFDELDKEQVYILFTSQSAKDIRDYCNNFLAVITDIESERIIDMINQENDKAALAIISCKVRRARAVDKKQQPKAAVKANVPKPATKRTKIRLSDYAN